MTTLVADDSRSARARARSAPFFFITLGSAFTVSSLERLKISKNSATCYLMPEFYLHDSLELTFDSRVFNKRRRRPACSEVIVVVVPSCLII